MSGPRAILIVARTPEAEAVAKGLPLSTAVPIFTAVLASWMRAAARAGAIALIAADREDQLRLGEVESSVPRTFLTQRGKRFGDRLAHAVEDAFALGIGSLIISGIDAPPPAPGELEQAFRALEDGRTDAIVTPAGDGGISMLGLRGNEPMLLRSIQVRSADVASKCVEYFGQRTVLVTAAVSDLDGLSGVAAAMADAAWRPFAGLLRQCLTDADDFDDEEDVVSDVAASMSASYRGPPISLR